MVGMDPWFNQTCSHGSVGFKLNALVVMRQHAENTLPAAHGELFLPFWFDARHCYLEVLCEYGPIDSTGMAEIGAKKWARTCHCFESKIACWNIYCIRE